MNIMQEVLPHNNIIKKTLDKKSSPLTTTNITRQPQGRVVKEWWSFCRQKPRGSSRLITTHPQVDEVTAPRNKKKYQIIIQVDEVLGAFKPNVVVYAAKETPAEHILKSNFFNKK